MSIEILKQMKKKLPRLRVRAIVHGLELELVVGVENELGMRFYYTELPSKIKIISTYLVKNEIEIVQSIKDFCGETYDETHDETTSDI